MTALSPLSTGALTVPAMAGTMIRCLHPGMMTVMASIVEVIMVGTTFLYAAAATKAVAAATAKQTMSVVTVERSVAMQNSEAAT